MSKLLSVYHDKFKHENSTCGGNSLHKVPSLTRSQILVFFIAGMSGILHGKSGAKAPLKFSNTLLNSKFQKIITQPTLERGCLK